MEKPILFDANMSPAGRRVRMALNLENIEFTRVEMNLGLLDQKSDEYLKINPTGVVPTLLIGVEAVFDSHVIVDRVLADGMHRNLLEERVLTFSRGALQNIERMLAQIMRPAVYETVGTQRLIVNYDTWEALETALISRGIKASNREYVRNLYSKSYNEKVVDETAESISEVLRNIKNLLVSVSSQDRSVINYFDICLGPRLHSITLLGLDRADMLKEYIACLTEKKLWRSTDSNCFSGEFVDYKESK